MAFFEELGRKAKDMAAVAADKARETTEKTKISVAIAGEQREIEKNCRLIGEWFINEYEGELPEGVQELADAVAASKARIAELEEQKNAIKVEHSEVSAAEPGMVRSLTASSVPSAALPWINAYTENQGRPMGGLGFCTESRNSLKC